MKLNRAVREEICRIAETAGYLWQKGWAECNGGNISLNLTAKAKERIRQAPAMADPVPLAGQVEILNNQLFYITGAGTRMRDVARAPLDNACIIRILQEGKAYEVIAGSNIKPTSELSSHLAIHQFMQHSGHPGRVVLHTHPTDLIALTHCPPFLDAAHLSRTLWSMIPETRVLVPKGVGIVPYTLTGTQALAQATIGQLQNHDIILWEKHGVLAIGEDILTCFDAIDALSKSAQIYLNARMAGCEPQGLSDEQLDELARLLESKFRLYRKK